MKWFHKENLFIQGHMSKSFLKTSCVFLCRCVEWKEAKRASYSFPFLGTAVIIQHHLFMFMKIQMMFLDMQKNFKEIRRESRCREV